MRSDFGGKRSKVKVTACGVITSTAARRVPSSFHLCNRITIDVTSQSRRWYKYAAQTKPHVHTFEVRWMLYVVRNSSLLKLCKTYLNWLRLGRVIVESYCEIFKEPQCVYVTHRLRCTLQLLWIVIIFAIKILCNIIQVFLRK